jgi:hypothetical protein
MSSSKFAFCYYADGMMWCQYPDGTWAHPFLASESRQRSKTSSQEEVQQELKETAETAESSN